MKTVWTDKPVTVLGLSKSGIASARYLASHGARVFLSETVPASPNNKTLRDELTAMGVEIEMGGHSARCFSHADFIILSPGIPPSSQILKELTLSGKTLISEVELAYRETDVPFVAITGTNGKTTTTTLISTILAGAGQKAPSCGNIGTPIISLVDTPADVFVAELSSYQLAFSPTLRAKVAVYMNFRPDHLDWHGSVAAYRQAKFTLFNGTQAPEWAILNADDPVCREVGAATSAQVLWFSRTSAHVDAFPAYITLDADGFVMMKTPQTEAEQLLPIDHIRLVGAHNQENVLAAAAASRLMGATAQQIETAVVSFPGVPHRLEPVATLDGIAYYNDSKATNPDATLSALAAFVPRQVVLIAGGRDKKTDLREFIVSVIANARHVVLLGEATDRFALELRAAGYHHFTPVDSLDDALTEATRHADTQTPVLFSPACASFDMFANFEARGDAFKTAVLSRRALAQQSST